MIAVDPDSVVYRAISGYGEGTGTMHLLRGVHTINFAFAGWHDGPVSVTMVGPDAAPVVVHQGPIHYDGTFGQCTAGGHLRLQHCGHRELEPVDGQSARGRRGPG